MDIQASTLNRVIACKGSLAMVGSGQLPTIDQEDTPAKREGSAMHFVAAEVIKGRISDPVEYVDRKMPNGVIITPEMAEAVSVYTDAVKLRPVIGLEGIEINCDWQCGEHRILCRTDRAAYDAASETLYIDDAKFGWRIIEPEGNWVLLAYAIGYCMLHNLTPAYFVFTIIQPRPYHEDGKVREWRIDAEEFRAWATALGQHISLIASDLALRVSDHCYQCPAMLVCPAYRKTGMNCIDVSNEIFVDVLTDDELAYTLENLERASDRLEKLTAAYKELGLHRAASGRIIPGYVVERPLSNRSFTIKADAAKALFGPKVVTEKLVTPAEAIRLGIDEKKLEQFITRYPGPPQLKRKDVNKTAAKAFKEK